MLYKIRVRRDKLLEGGIDIVEMDVGDESIDAGVDAGGLRSMHVAALRHKMGQHLQIGEPSLVRRIRLVAANALKVIPLQIELSRLSQAVFRQARMLLEQRVAEIWPEPVIPRT